MRRIWIAVIMLGLTSIACELIGAPPTLAVITQTVPAPSITPLGLPPSWTPGPAPTSTAKSLATSTPLPTVAAVNTLPPSWTPGAIPTSTARPMATLPGLTPPTALPSFTATATQSGPGKPPSPVPQVTYSAVCDSFQVVRAGTVSIINANTQAKITWTKVDEAEGYEVWVVFLDGRYLIDQKTTDTSIMIPASTFTTPGGYGWEVMPLKDGDRLCGSLTGTIVVRG